MSHPSARRPALTTDGSPGPRSGVFPCRTLSGDLAANCDQLKALAGLCRPAGRPSRFTPPARRSAARSTPNAPRRRRRGSPPTAPQAFARARSSAVALRSRSTSSSVSAGRPRRAPSSVARAASSPRRAAAPAGAQPATQGRPWAGPRPQRVMPAPEWGSCDGSVGGELPRPRLGRAIRPDLDGSRDTPPANGSAASLGSQRWETSRLA